MMRRSPARWLRRNGVIAAALSASLMATLPAPAFAQEIWLGPKWSASGSGDFMDLFRPDAPWSHAASHVSVVGLSAELMARGSDEDLALIIRDLKRRNIDLALGMLPLSGAIAANDGRCGYHVEGYSAPGETAVVARRMKALGAEPRYYGMDEPLFFGHMFRGPNACRSSVEDVVRDVAAKVRQVREVFPSVRIGDAEPFMAIATKPGLAVLENWLDAYAASVGERLAFLALDMDWRAPWRDLLPGVADLLRRKGVRLVAIYNGNDNAASDEEWIAQAVAHYKSFDAAVPYRPYAVSIQTWVSHPRRVLPDTDPHTLTGLVNQYVAWQASQRR
jgi:hypothetical protein